MKKNTTELSAIQSKIAEFRKQGFSNDQLLEIKQGLEHGVDVSLYARQEYLAVQMHHIRIGLEKGLNVALYNSEEYDWFQMQEIRLGLEQGVDAVVYARPQFSYEVMREIRKALADGIHLENYAAAGAELLHELHESLLEKINIFPYIKEGYVPEQLQEIRNAIYHGCKIDPYLNKAFRGVAIKEIWKGLEKALDVSMYTNPEYSWRQMREIRLGLEKRLDVSVYAKELYSWGQMREIRLGLEQKLDIGQYKSMMYSASDMRKKRKKLREEKKRAEKIMQSPQQKLLREQIEKYCENFAVDTKRIILSPDKMAAYFYVGPEAKTPNRAELEKQLKQHRVQAGIDEDMLDALVQGEHRKELVVIASGKVPQKGMDGYYEFYFKTDRTVEKRTLQDGTVDYANVQWFQKVYIGQKIAVYHNATMGESGWNIEGKVLDGKAGTEQSALKGRGFRLLEDGRTYVSEQNGCIAIRKNCLMITPLLELAEVSTVTDSVDYNGSIHIKGDVRADITIHATGDIAVDGFVENAELHADGDIFIQKGTNGNGRAQLTAGGNVIGKFFENVSITANIMQSNYFFRCTLHANESITTDGVDGNIAGGTVYAGNCIEAGNIGNRNGIVTVLRSGLFQQKEEVEDTISIKELERQITIFKNALAEFKKKYPPEIRNAMPTFLKIENAIYTNEEEKKRLENEIKQKQEIKEKLQQAYIKVTGTLYEGTVVMINGGKFEGDTMKSVLLQNRNHKMKVLHI